MNIRSFRILRSPVWKKVVNLYCSHGDTKTLVSHKIFSFYLECVQPFSRSLFVPEPTQSSRSSSPQSYVTQERRSPVLSSGSGVFENESPRKKSQPHSDKGYGSTTSVSSGSSGDSKSCVTMASNVSTCRMCFLIAFSIRRKSTAHKCREYKSYWGCNFLQRGANFIFVSDEY